MKEITKHFIPSYGPNILVYLSDYEALQERCQKLEAELESLRQQVKAPDAGWIAWGGGECPVAPGTVVEAKFIDGYQNEYEACVIGWGRNKDHADIIAYRIV